MTSSTKVTLADIFPPRKFLLEELSRNREGGRIVYKVTDKVTKESVVVKQYRFAGADDWTAYEHHDRELRVIKAFDHPSIPKLIKTYETDDGFLLVQEYKNAPSLAELMSQKEFSATEIKAFLAAMLLVLSYVHEKGHICHGDIQPGNILLDLDNGISVYLVDFGLSRSDGGSVILSEILGGTLGFTAPDQVLNRKAEPHGDIYGLAVCLICMITKTEPANVYKLRDEMTFRYNFRGVIKVQMPEYVLKWMERCVSPNSKERFQSARLAHEAMKLAQGRSKGRRTTQWGAGLALSITLGGLYLWSAEANEALAVQPQMTVAVKAASKAEIVFKQADLFVEARRQEAAIAFQQEEERKKVARQQEEARREAARQQAIFNQRRENTRRLLETRSCVGCDLVGVDLSRIDLEGADLREANLTDAVMEASKLARASLAGAVLDNADFSSANISGANFTDAQLTSAQLDLVNGVGANFRGAILKNANLGGAILHESDFTGADLSNSNLTNTKFHNANLEMANLDGTLRLFTSFRDARLPNGFER
ncbi:pentapeptide repeat-containing protein [Nodosilinea sp. LEGE 07298]|uniref:pentapeptide repeat-containing protein n=1 Tax=Nodosilinea sp. LEGE 07298 TaxID=2777970 RepID=UPI001882FDC0|nr:pentapeptide repeat-containing protein [Nodosilinea sp. LEGE 07298]MBE9108239.1 pentapeptide repeat-containing protein [Nodosilinea sp. LEGE 07298]